MSKSQELRKHLDSRLQRYDLSPERDRELRQVIWEGLLSWGLLQVCVLVGAGENLKIKKQDGHYYKVEDSKTFIAGIFFTINKYLNEVPGNQMRQRVVEVCEKVLSAFHELKKISNQVALDSDHKSQKGEFKIPRKEKINQLQNDICSWTNGLLRGKAGPDIEKSLETVRDEKVREKLLIEQLYFCFRQYCPRLFKKDIYYNMAKIVLCLGKKREERIKKQISINEQLIIKEANRIQRNRRRHPRCPGGLQPDFWPPIDFLKRSPANK